MKQSNQKPTFFLNRLANDIRKHYALNNVNLKIVPDKIMQASLKTVGAFVWNMILFSDGLLKKSHDLQTTVLVHEFGHRVLFPETRAKQELYSLISQNAGIPEQNIGRFLNIIGDLLINRANLYDVWHLQMYRGLKESYFSPKEKRTTYNDYTFFLNILNASLKEYRNSAPTDLTEVEKKAYHLLFEDVRQIKERVKDLAELLKPLFCAQPEPEKSKTGKLPLPASELPFSEPLKDDDLREIANELLDISSDIIDTVKKNKRLLREMRRRRALGLVLPRIGSSAVQFKSRGTCNMWTPGKSINDLDLKSSISSFGKVIPGETTMGITSVDSVASSDGTGYQMTILLDVSSSMSTNNRQERMIDAAVALNRAAKKSNYSVSIIGFGHRSDFIQKPTLDYELVEEKIFTIEANQNDTRLYPALQLVRSGNAKPLVYILTDAGIYDIVEQKVVEIVKKITAHGRCILFLIGSEDELDDNIRKTLKEMKVQAYLVPDGVDYSGTIVESVLRP
jgi:Mg-chelatase subunit ChlD